MNDHTPCLPVVGAHTRVPLINGTSTTYANLDCAASAPALVAVQNRVNQVLPLYASVHRGAGYLSQVSTALYEAARTSIGKHVAARDNDVTIITRNTTDSLNLLAGCIPNHADGTPGKVLVLDIEHHANLLPWHAAPGGATTLVTATTIAETLDQLRAELARERYALVALTGASNVTGESLPITDVVDIAHAAGARIALDGAQLIPHRGFSLANSGVDYVAFSGHKTYAPYGAGALIGRRDWLDTGHPYLAGGGAVKNVTLTDVTWAPAPARHEAGSPNVIGAVALAAACEALGGLPAGELERHEAVLRTRLVDGLSAIDGVRILRLWEDSTDPVGVVSFTVADCDPGLVAAYLSAEHGIGVRDGRFCAHPLLTRLGVDNGAIRASVGVGSTLDDVERLIAAVALWVTEGSSDNYDIIDGCWAVHNDPRPTPAGSGLDGLIATAAAAVANVAAGCGPTPRQGVASADARDGAGVPVPVV
ncbi:aminotransferase class V-fold PLP-dependent enzyme [Jonesia quinghaiensis]|uniref:aminotransferase class V-fold PLP-dependent enzyme n=1 Tax=Jonesia quinghaiensis TaxID=262806 RepID=UPI00048C457D|nr:aminotransferase class V-fold PLP-dependent enzyme [Jonesia quinghaiensis]